VCSIELLAFDAAFFQHRSAYARGYDVINEAISGFKPLSLEHRTPDASGRHITLLELDGLKPSSLRPCNNPDTPAGRNEG
jgi:hypothetical protein